MFSFALDQGWVVENPVLGVSVQVNKSNQKQRVPFSSDDLARLFHSPAVSLSNIRGTKASGGEAAKWIPLIALFTGARLEEIGQLRCRDVRKESGIWIFHFHDEDLGRDIKTEGSRRTVPVHSYLIEQGLLKYRDSLTGDFLFPDLPVLPSGTGQPNGRSGSAQDVESWVWMEIAR